MLLLVTGIGIGAAATAMVVTEDDDSPDGISAARLTQVQASCEDWMRSSDDAPRSDDPWCTDMFAWMSNQSGGSTMGSMMWQGPAQISGACRDWADQSRAGTSASDLERCHDMVEWMDDHMSSRGGTWMMPQR